MVSGETYNPWTIVNLVFHHLVDQGLQPTLGESGDPGVPAAELLHALGVGPTVEASAEAAREQRDHDLAQLRARVMDDP